jgi:probable F420-dependent oxidoreductase
VAQPPVKVTLRLPIAAERGSDPATLIDLARRAEASGFAAVSLSDHVVMGPRADLYPWGDFRFPPEAPWYEPLIVLSAIAAATSRIGLTTGILIAPLRPAVLLAKTVATLDCVSGGRVELGVGTGWQREEFAALGVPYDTRGQALTDSIGACRQMWSSSPASFESATVTFEDVWCDPKPAGSRRIPILFSGTLNERNRQRILRLGDGWIPIMTERRPGIASGVQELRALFEREGRDPGELRIRSAARMGATVAETLEKSQALVDIGVNDIDLPISAFGDLEPGEFFSQAERALKESGWSAS